MLAKEEAQKSLPALSLSRSESSSADAAESAEAVEVVHKLRAELDQVSAQCVWTIARISSAQQRESCGMVVRHKPEAKRLSRVRTHALAN